MHSINLAPIGVASLLGVGALGLISFYVIVIFIAATPNGPLRAFVGLGLLTLLVVVLYGLLDRTRPYHELW